MVGKTSLKEWHKSVEVFDTHNQTWKPEPALPPMLRPRRSHRLVALNKGRTIVALGGSKNVNETRTAELLSLSNDGNPLQWIPIPSMNTKRDDFGAVMASTTQPGILIAGGDNRQCQSLDSMEFLPEPSEEDILCWTLLNSCPLKKLVLKARGPSRQQTYRIQAEEWIEHAERQRDDYLSKVIKTMHEMTDEQTRSPTLAQEELQGQTELDQGLDDNRQEFADLPRAAKEYSSRVDESILFVKRIIGVDQLDPTPMRGLPSASWESSNKIHIEEWLQDTERERANYEEEVSASVSVSVSVSVGKVDEEIVESLQGWIDEIQERANDYYAKVDERIARAKRIVEFLTLWTPPSLKDVPCGVLDYVHQAQVEGWIEENGKEREEYETRVTASIGVMRDDLQARRDCSDGDVVSEEEELVWVPKINTLQHRMDEYCRKVEERMKVAGRMVAFVRLRTPPILKDLSMVSLSDKAKVEGWIGEVEDELLRYASRVSACINSMMNDVEARKAALGREDGAELDDALAWNGILKSLQGIADEYWSVVDKRVRRARSIIDILVASPPPPIRDVPRGPLDVGHKVQVEQWVEETEEQRIEYVNELTMAMDGVREEEAVGTHQLVSDSYCARVKESMDYANKIIEFVRLLDPPEWDGIPKMDTAHIEEWAKKVESQRREYESAVDAAIKLIKEGRVTEEGWKGCETLKRKADDHCSATNDKILSARRFVRVVAGSKDSAAPPDELLCPITHKVMVDPVIAMDGHTYEKAAIERVFEDTPVDEYPRSPVTGGLLSSRSLIPNVAIRSLCMVYRESKA